MEKLGKVLEQVVKNLRSGDLQIEEHAKIAVIVPVLAALGWDPTNTKEFCAEYPVDSGRVDFALGVPDVHNQALVFVEAKRLGYLTPEAVDQVFDYAANKGIPLLVLTDGNIWDFYLSMAAGEPPDRLFYRIELDAAGDLSDYEESFRKFLSKDQVASEDARREAEELLQDNKRREQAKVELPGAWQELFTPPDDILVELLAEKVQDRCGIRLRHEDVEQYIRGRYLTPVVPTEASLSTGQGQATEPESASKVKIVGYRLHESEVRTRSSIATLQAILNDLQSRDQSFLHRMYDDSRNRNTKGKVVLVARRYEDFPQQDRRKKLDDGWWLYRDWGVDGIRNWITVACEVAGVEFGTELTLIEIEK